MRSRPRKKSVVSKSVTHRTVPLLVPIGPLIRRVRPPLAQPARTRSNSCDASECHEPIRSAANADRRDRRRRHGWHLRRGAPAQGRHRDVHDLRGVRTGRRHVVGQPVSGRRGRRRLVHLLVPVQALRLDPHPRAPGRDPRVPRGDSSRLRTDTAPAPRRRRAARGVGRRPPRLSPHADERRHDRVPRAHLGGRLPQRAVLPRLARPPRLRRSLLPHVAVGTRARPVQQDGGRRRHRLDRLAARPRAPADRRQDRAVPTRAGLGAAEG